jgi:C4-dicarboxylate-specific signal transduction histidine kinase
MSVTFHKKVRQYLQFEADIVQLEQVLINIIIKTATEANNANTDDFIDLFIPLKQKAQVLD